jgi:ankyrin repeat protein
VAQLSAPGNKVNAYLVTRFQAGYCALAYAVHAAAAKLLLAHGADHTLVDRVGARLFFATASSVLRHQYKLHGEQEHHSVLQGAIINENVEVVTALLDFGASLGPADEVRMD